MRIFHVKGHTQGARQQNEPEEYMHRLGALHHEGGGHINKGHNILSEGYNRDFNNIPVV
jgi:hypothetical protein